MNPVQKFIAVNNPRVLGARIIRPCAGSQDDVVRFNLLVLLKFGGNPNPIFSDQCPASKRYPDIELFQFFLQLVGQSSAGSSLGFDPLLHGFCEQICIDPCFLTFEKLAMKSRRRMESTNSVGSMMEPRTSKCTTFDDDDCEPSFRCQERHLAASRTGADHRNLIFFIHNAAENVPSTKNPACACVV